jgi:phage terminase Nu1 subunit (DNA packaging protein)
MDETEVRDWFAEYLRVFAALGRGEARPSDVLGFYGVPCLVTTDEEAIVLWSTDEVAAWLQSQGDAMEDARYDRTETLDSEVEILNLHTAVHQAQLARQRADGTEINQMTVTYLVARGSEGFHISALVLHSP